MPNRECWVLSPLMSKDVSLITLVLFRRHPSCLDHCPCCPGRDVLLMPLMRGRSSDKSSPGEDAGVVLTTLVRGSSVGINHTERRFDLSRDHLLRS